MAVGPDGRLYATTRARALRVRSEHGDLALVYDAGGDTLHGLAASGDHVWFADGTELGVVDGDHVAETSGRSLAPDARLAPSRQRRRVGRSRAALQRFARAEPEPALAVTLVRRRSRPSSRRSCSACHQPGGVSGTDLSTAEAWQSERGAIRDRVVKSTTMPPEGHPLSETNRAAIRAWVESPSP